MIRIPRRALLAASLLAAPAIQTGAVQAQGFPSRPVRAVVPFPPAGGVDVFARAFVPAFAAALGQGVVIENIGGASSRVGNQAVLRAAADGHTILITNDTLAAVEALPIPGSGPFVPGLAPVLLGVAASHVVVAHPRAGLPDAAAYAARLRSRRPVNVGVPGLGTAHHFASELLGQALGGRPEHVAYRGGGPLLVDVLGGTLDAGVVTLNAALDHIREGRLVALGVTGKERSPAAPGIPTFAETVAPEFEIRTWIGLLAPAGTPAPALAALQAAGLGALRDPRVVQRLNGQGFDVEGRGPEAFGALVRDTVARFAAVAGAVGLRPEDA
ncbi:tripartite tricarboxylate transporter substrate binding protein [Roseococcus sp. SYP-B2431]|uniref:Bug family tripartite tricarboxylate transporter substrate binding protein n=1 Tax=Roseococcus sp. SYP-B2431 TaxID=2496640 RepID=UPI00103FA192|nr:tripartite tricarboxylate transporter substrate binding protein [Roseococcus sp. SYP-B2431]TCH99506.1 tripartite tricarboxylate transporter substrate binding protein [Roseococcus sp. SYP-B2431]